ncbi:hypothetical protein [Jannaschia seosinensis]|uniref:hypothetical protein n=1 Tax=Jannaschia seosinensis TaxID=313367 RepID=UPI0006E227C9|nr:hypothetical protein [Jannaschia seosinensis]
MSDDASALRADLDRVIAGRPISLVGNARSLLDTGHGAAIDRGCVVRLNSGIPVRRSAQGRRIDIHCFSTRPSLEYNLRRGGWRTWLRRGYFRNAFPIWMSGLDRETCQDPAQAFYPTELLDALTERLGARPSVGAMALDMLVRLTDAPITLYGFDFKTSTTFYRKRENRGPHDWEAERRIAMALAEEGRIAVKR